MGEAIAHSFIWAAELSGQDILFAIASDLTLLGDREKAEELQSVDFTELRSHHWSIRIGPPGRALPRSSRVTTDF